MSYANVGIGASVVATNASTTPTMPPFSAGNLLLLFSGMLVGSGTPPTAPTGYTKLSTNGTATEIAVYGRIAVGGDTAPTLPSWGNVPQGTMMASYSGNPNTLSGIVLTSNERKNSNAQGIVNGSLTVTTSNCLIISAGLHNKSATGNGGTFSTFNGMTIRNTSIVNGNTPALVLNDLVQGVATNIASATQNFSIAESSAVPYESIFLALIPAAGVPAGGTPLGCVLGVG